MVHSAITPKGELPYGDQRIWRDVCVGVPTTGGEVHTFDGVTSVDI